MAAISKNPTAGKSLKRNFTVKPTHCMVGKAAVAEEETGISTLQTVVIGAQASQERSSEITSERSGGQPGQVDNLQRLLQGGQTEVEESWLRLAQESVRARKEE
jgi:hypothetical protein